MKDKPFCQYWNDTAMPFTLQRFATQNSVYMRKNGKETKFDAKK